MRKNNFLNLLVNPFVIFSSLLLLFIFVSLHPVNGYDEGLWTYMGRLWHTYGIAPYVGVIENKTPGIFILYAIADVFNDYNIVFVRTIGVFASFLTLIMLYRICNVFYNIYAGIICACFYGLTLCWSSMDGFAFAQTETFMVFFSVLAFYILIINFNKTISLKWIFLSGLSLGGALAFKQIAVTTTISFLLVFWLFSNNQNLKFRFLGVVTIILGIGVATILSYLPLLFYNVSFFEYLDGAWFVLLNSGSKVQGISEHLKNFSSVFFATRFVLYLPLLLLFLLQKELRAKKIMFYCLIIWMFFDFLGTNASGYYYGHQIKQLLPSISVIGGICIAHLISKNRRKLRDLKQEIGVSIFVISLIFFPYKQFAFTSYYIAKGITEETLSYSEVGDFIEKNTTKDDYVYVLGADVEVVHILAQSQRRASSRYINSIFISNESQRLEVLGDVKKTKPKYILKHDTFLNVENIYGQAFVDLLNAKYRLLKTWNDIIIYEKI